MAEEEPYARCRHRGILFTALRHDPLGEEADKAVMVDGCFLKCQRRIFKNLIDEEKMIHIEALPLHERYGDIFFMDDVPEPERNNVARRVADKILVQLKQEVTYARI